MTKLIKIELKKLFAKKMIYIFLAVVLGLTLGITVLEKNLNKVFDSIEYGLNADLYKESMDSYDLKDPEQLKYYVDDKTYYDTIMIAKEYKTFSAEHYYVENEINSSIYCMNENEYITKDKNAYNECKKKYDEQMEFLKHYDGKEYIQSKLKDVNDEIQRLEFAINSGTLSGKEVENQLKVSKLAKEVLDYRIEHNIPIDGSSISRQLESYVMTYTNYLNIDEDKNLVNREDQLLQNDLIANYNVTKYKFENGYFADHNRENSDFTTADDVVAIFSSGMFATLFLVLIGGSIIAEEFNKGTIKQLLLKPYTRTKIILSKFFASIIVFLVFLIIYAIGTVLIDAIAYGEISSLFQPMLYYDLAKGEVIKHSVLFACIEQLIVILPMYLILLGLSLLLGVITTNTAVAIIVPIVVNSAAGIINMIAKSRIFAFLPTMCWDLSAYLHGGISPFKYSTLPISIVVDIITIVLLYGATIVIFNKKDIKNQ